MPLETNNPFTLNNYVIAESSIYDCSNLINKSTIVSANADIQTYISNGYILSNKMNLLEVNKYITNEMNNFLTKINLAKTCSIYIMQDNTSSEECKSTFTNYDTSKAQFGLYTNVLDNFTYTATYKNKQSNINNKKNLCQRLADLQSLMNDYKQILDNINTAEVKSKYSDQYDLIIREHTQNLHIRRELEEKLDFIYSTESRFGNSKQYLDSTVYISVLWTILATTILFYIFKKM